MDTSAHSDQSAVTHVPAARSAATVPVVIGIDFSDASDVALRQAFAMVNATPWAEPHVVYVATAYGPMVRVETPEDIFTGSIEEASERVRGHVETIVDAFRREQDTYFERVVTHIRVGSAAPARAASEQPDQYRTLGLISLTGCAG